MKSRLFGLFAVLASLALGLAGCGGGNRAPVYRTSAAPVVTSSYGGTRYAAQPGTMTQFAHRHKTLLSVGAGVATYKALKYDANRRAANGQNLTFAHKHPLLTAVAAGALTHHLISKSQRSYGYHHGHY